MLELAIAEVLTSQQALMSIVFATNNQFSSVIAADLGCRSIMALKFNI
jgi:hypothetical protein